MSPNSPSLSKHSLNPSPFPDGGVVAYLSIDGPVVATTLTELESLRSRPDYESCNPILSDAQLAIEWDYSLAGYPRCPVTQPIRVSQQKIDVEWDIYKLRALIRGSQVDANALAGRMMELERGIHDADRVIVDAHRRMRINNQETWALDANIRERFGLRATPRVDMFEVVKRAIKADWDVYKLRKVFSAIQADVDRLLHEITHLEAKLEKKQHEMGDTSKFVKRFPKHTCRSEQ
ncbi:uncharacterized protein CTRU02_212344 [Colletotrichum truncatum]|uniref:Uncharacterized protein n=1 Tax=Colletotrichum truncatum TaxID=5467 RepID=A0ACC3YNV3_COLTU|nr:uncharacterized protein CTRU02_08777 [Colletotrichum truncatum]KAF6789530.1 hypothetical protein CTRU02_08777 [Colletotrichum truncatum]